MMKFAVINKETDRLVVAENYYFVIRQDGELYTVNHDLTFTKADEKYEVISALNDDERMHYGDLQECCNKILDSIDAGKVPQRAVIGLRLLMSR